MIPPFHRGSALSGRRINRNVLHCRAMQSVMRILMVVLALYGGISVSMAQTQFSTFVGSLPSYYTISTQWLWGVSFVTDDNTYDLDSITMGMASGSATPVTFTGGLYPGYGGGNTELETLGSDVITTPNAFSYLTFTSGYQILLPNTRYTAIFSSDVPASVLVYDSWNATGPWSLALPYPTYAESVYSSDGGIYWGGTSPPLAFSVDATVVPEPFSAVLMFVGLIAFCFRKMVFVR
jgi:hypothetical protein